MARAGMALSRGVNHAEGGDDVQRSIELLDRVLSEFDDVENANQVQNMQQLSTSISTPQLQQQQSIGSISTNSRNATPEEESPSLGHQSEDDGYMSMNGRKPPKFHLAFRAMAEIPVHHENAVQQSDDFPPPPPEEAQRLIATLLPKVSPTHRTKTSSSNGRGRSFPLTQLRTETTIPPPQNFQNNDFHLYHGLPDPVHTAIQTTLPKTRHQRPFGWENNDFSLNPPPPPPGYYFGSLPYYHAMYPLTSPTRVPPRTVPTAVERHREVKRHGSEDNLSSDLDEIAPMPSGEFADDEHFSDDSLEEMLPPPPPPVNKRASIAWEVPLEDEALLTPGSTKVIGRRRRKSGSYSSTSSIPNKLKELDDWPDPPQEAIASPFSDSDEQLVLPNELQSGTSTYVIRRSKKERKSVMDISNSSINSRLSSDLSIPRYNADFRREVNEPAKLSIDVNRELNSPKSRLSLDLNNMRKLELSRNEPPTATKKHSSTFDSIQSLIKQNILVEKLPSPTINVAPENVGIVRVVSLPSLVAEGFPARRELDVTVEEEEEVDHSQLSEGSSSEISPLRKIEQNISELLERRDIDEDCLLQKLSGGEKTRRKVGAKNYELQKSVSNNEILRSEDYYRQLLIEGSTSKPFPKRNGIQKSESAKEMLISHRIERDARIATSNSADFPICVEVVQHDFPPLPPSPVEETEEEYSDIPQHPHLQKSKADTLPNEPQQPPLVPPHRDPISNSLKTRSMDVNYSRTRRANYYSSNRSALQVDRRTLPNEMPESNRRQFQKRSKNGTPEDNGHQMMMQTSCSLPETPIFARGYDIPRTPHRRAPDVPGGNQKSSTLGSNMSSRRGLEQAIVGAELLQMAGGPGRGWYPKQRSRRPASIEHLDRIATGQNPWDSSRKPLTLPPNLTPKFFQRSPRDALRRVTSLLIRKGNTAAVKETKKEIVSSTIHENSNVEEVQKKRGFFKNLWKRSRHYSLEQQ